MLRVSKILRSRYEYDDMEDMDPGNLDPYDNDDYDPGSYDPDEDLDEFADPGGRSALRAGERVYPCPTCDSPNRLSASDKRRGYQCDACADAAEFGGY